MQLDNQVQKPFFAQFLEAQQSTEGQGNGIWPIITNKLTDHPNETQKFPSDGDETDI